jgi:hypothetical protein
MILIRERATGALQAVERVDGGRYPRRRFEILGEIPAGVEPTLAALDGGAIGNKLEVERGLRWHLVKRRALAAELAGCATPRGRMDTGPQSQAALNLYATQAIGQGEAFVPILWTMADNSFEIHDGPAIVAAHLAVALHVSACHARAQELRAELAAAETLEAIGAVAVDQGWPG